MTFHDLFEPLAVLPPWQQAVLILAGSIALSKIVEVVGIRTVRRYTEISETDVDDLLLRIIHLPIYATIILLGVLLSVDVLALPEATGQYLFNGTVTIILLVWAHVVNRFGNEVVDILQDEEVAQDIAPFASNLLSVFVFIAVGAALLSIWEINITPFIASAGVIGIVFGFAAREALANFIGGVALYFDDTYRVGDVLLLESGERGTVKNVGIRSTTVLTRDNVLVTIPNSVLNDARVINQSAPEQQKRIRIPISVAYGTDIALVDELIDEICEEHDRVLDNPAPRLYLLEFGDSALQFELQIYTAHPLHEKRVLNEINRRVYERFGEADIEIPFPQRTLHGANDAVAVDPSANTDGEADLRPDRGENSETYFGRDSE